MLFDPDRRAVARHQSLPAPRLSADPVERLDQDARLAGKRLAHLLSEARMAPRAPVDPDAKADADGAFAPQRRRAPTPVESDGLGHDASLVGIIDPRDERGIPVRDHGPRTAVRRTAGCTSLHRDRGSSRATFSGC